MQRTIPPDSRTAMFCTIGPPAILVSTALAAPSPVDDPVLVGAAQSYLTCLTAGATPGPALRPAWDEFHRSCAPLVDRAARGRRGDRGTDADASQEIWLALVERLGSFRVDAGAGSFPGWLRTVARRRLIDRRRAEARRPFPATWDEPPVHVAGAEPDPAEACERAEERTRLGELLARLRVEVSALNYRVLHLRAIEERSPGEVGRLVGLSAEQVRVRHHRMLERLRRLAGSSRAGGAKDSEKNPDRRATPTLLATC